MKGGNARQTRMKPGVVVQIRVPPADVMSCIDLVKKANLITQGMSIAEVVRLALSGLCGGARKAGLIPQRDGFEFNEMIQPFRTWGQARKLQITNDSWQMMQQAQAHDFRPVHDRIGEIAFETKPELSNEEREAKSKRFRELRDQRLALKDITKFPSELSAEIDRLYDELHG